MNGLHPESWTNPNFSDPKGVQWQAFKFYVGSMSLYEKIKYLEFLENSHRLIISEIYFSTFQKFDFEYLQNYPVEVVTRIQYIYSDVNGTS